MRTKALLLVALMVTMSLSGCFGDEIVIEEVVEEEVEQPRTFVTDKTGASIDVPLIDMTFQFSDVGETGKECSFGEHSAQSEGIAGEEPEGQPIHRCKAGVNICEGRWDDGTKRW